MIFNGNSNNSINTIISYSNLLIFPFIGKIGNIWKIYGRIPLENNLGSGEKMREKTMEDPWKIEISMVGEVEYFSICSMVLVYLPT